MTSLHRRAPHLLWQHIRAATALGFAVSFGAVLQLQAGGAPDACGEWPQAAFDARHSGYNRFENILARSNVKHLTELWNAPIDGGIYASPIVSEGKLFIGGGDRRMHAFDAVTGAAVWIGCRQPLFFVDSAAAGHGLVFASGLYSTLLAYDGDTGEIAWTSALTDVRASPTLAGGKLYVASFDGTLSALDPANGASIWSVKGSCCVYDQAPVVDGGRVFQTRTDGTMTAYNTLTGTQLWSRAAFSVGTMAAGHGKIFFNDYPNVVALDEETGARVWATPVGSESEPTAPVLANGMVFVTQSRLWALNAQTGAVVWSAPVESFWGPTVANGVVYASNQSGEWDAFDERDGTLLWSVVIDGGCFFSCANAVPVVANGILYLAGPDDKVHAFGLNR